MNDASKLNVRRWAFERMMYGDHDQQAVTVLQRRDVGCVDGCEQGEGNQYGDGVVASVTRLDDRQGGDNAKGSRLSGFPKKFSFLRKEG